MNHRKVILIIFQTVVIDFGCLTVMTTIEIFVDEKIANILSKELHN